MEMYNVPYIMHTVQCLVYSVQWGIMYNVKLHNLINYWINEIFANKISFFSLEIIF